MRLAMPSLKRVTFIPEARSSQSRSPAGGVSRENAGLTLLPAAEPAWCGTVVLGGHPFVIAGADGVATPLTLCRIEDDEDVPSSVSLEADLECSYRLRRAFVLASSSSTSVKYLRVNGVRDTFSYVQRSFDLIHALQGWPLSHFAFFFLQLAQLGGTFSTRAASSIVKVVGRMWLTMRTPHCNQTRSTTRRSIANKKRCSLMACRDTLMRKVRTCTKSVLGGPNFDCWQVEGRYNRTTSPMEASTVRLHGRTLYSLLMIFSWPHSISTTHSPERASYQLAPESATSCLNGRRYLSSSAFTIQLRVLVETRIIISIHPMSKLHVHHKT